MNRRQRAAEIRERGAEIKKRAAEINDRLTVESLLDDMSPIAEHWLHDQLSITDTILTVSMLSDLARFEVQAKAAGTEGPQARFIWFVCVSVDQLGPEKVAQNADALAIDLISQGIQLLISKYKGEIHENS